jgi:hypothetical protein
MSMIILPGQEPEAPAAHEPPGSKRIYITGFRDQPEAPLNPVDGAPEERVSLLIDPDRMRALPEELRDYNCSTCNRRNAGWAFLPSNKGPDPDPIPICSLCWLYLSNWARPRVREVPAFIARFEQTTGKKFTKDAGGALTDHRQGDEVVAQLLRASVVYLRWQRLQEQLRGR